MITAHPNQARPPSRSPASVKPKNAAQTGSSENASAVCVAVARRWAHVCARNASALAKTPVTRRAPQTVQPCGHASCAGRVAIDEQARARGDHLDQRECDRVVDRREALHQHDLQRVDGGSREHEQVAGRRARVNATRAARARLWRAGRRPTPRAPPGPGRAASASSGVSTTYIPVMKPVDETDVRSRPGRLQRIARAEQRACERAGRHAGPPERPQPAQADRGEGTARDREAQGEEREQGIQRDRVLDLDERHAPDGGHVQPGRSGRAPARLNGVWPLRAPNTPAAGVGSYGSRHGRARHLRAAAARPAHLGHRPLQLPLRLLHAEGGLRARPCFLDRRELLTFEEIARVARRLRRRRRAQDPHHGRRAARAARSRAADRAAGGARRRPDPDDERLAAARRRRSCSRTRACGGSPSASTRSTTRSSAR